MKWYGSAPDASMSMHEDPELIQRLEALIQEKPITVAIETGTYNGTGSTRWLAEIFQRTIAPRIFCTIEVNYGAAMEARKNLQRFPFVRQIWGSSVEIKKAVNWLANDEALQNPHNYPDIWIDHIDQENSFEHYAAEIQRTYDFPPDHRDLWEGEGLLGMLLKQNEYHRPLVILDSAGGIGWYEFQITVQTMEDKPYYLLLDDVQHIKHFRSLAYVKERPEKFTILYEGGKAALAVHL